MLKEPDSGLLAAFASAWGAIVAKEEVDKAGGTLDKADAGSGPYMIEEWIPNQSLKLKRFPDYYDKNVAHLDGVTFQVIPEESAIIAQLRSGSVHLTALKDNKNHQVVKDVPNLDTIRGPRLGFDYLDIDNQREPFNKLEVRQALQVRARSRGVPGRLHLRPGAADLAGPAGPEGLRARPEVAPGVQAGPEQGEGAAGEGRRCRTASRPRSTSSRRSPRW